MYRIFPEKAVCFVPFSVVASRNPQSNHQNIIVVASVLVFVFVFSFNAGIFWFQKFQGSHLFVLGEHVPDHWIWVATNKDASAGDYFCPCFVHFLVEGKNCKIGYQENEDGTNCQVSTTTIGGVALIINGTVHQHHRSQNALR